MIRFRERYETERGQVAAALSRPECNFVCANQPVGCCSLSHAVCCWKISAPLPCTKLLKLKIPDILRERREKFCKMKILVA